MPRTNVNKVSITFLFSLPSRLTLSSKIAIHPCKWLYVGSHAKICKIIFARSKHKPNPMLTQMFTLATMHLALHVKTRKDMTNHSADYCN